MHLHSTESFATFGDLLRYLRRRERLTQRELGIAVGYSESQINRLEHNIRVPEPYVIAAQFIQALHLEDDSQIAVRLVELAAKARGEPMPAAFAVKQLAEDVATVSESKRQHGNNLPAQLTRFVGRHAALAELTARIRVTRLLTLTGAGGVGKTRLALEIAARFVTMQAPRPAPELFRDGVWLIEFASVATAEGVIQEAATTLGMTEQAGTSLLEALSARLRGWSALLIFDNCEHLVAACASLAEQLVHSCAELHILATSREPLRVYGEVIWRVPSLRTPDPIHPPSLKELLENEAVELFVDRARANQPSFDVTVRSAAALMQVCCRLDGIPLAIELAAAWTHSLPVEEIAERLDDRFGLLVRGSRTALPRHQTLRAALAWSVDMLVPSERKLFMQLSVFSGGFILGAVEAVSDQSNTFDLLSNLVDKSLVMADTRCEVTRYRFSETIRQFAQGLLHESGEANIVCDRHLNYFLMLAEKAEIAMRGQALQTWRISLETDLDNVRSALRWAFESGQFEQGLRLAGALWLFWCMHEHAREGLGWIRKFLEASADLPVPTAVRSKALYGAAMLAWRMQEWRVIERFAQESLPLSRELCDPVGVAFSLICQGYFTEYHLSYQLARNTFEEALGLLRAAQHRWGIGLVMLCLGELFLIQGEFGQAEAALGESLSLFQTLDWWFIMDALVLMVGAALAQGDRPHAKALAQQKLVLGREWEQSRMCCRALRELGHIAIQEGHYQRATELFEECIALFQTSGYVEPRITHALADLGFISLLQGDYGMATQRFNEALAFYQETAIDASIGHAQLCLGYTLRQQGDLSGARIHIQESLNLARKTGHTTQFATVLAAMGDVLQAQGYGQPGVRLCGFAAKFDNILRVLWLPPERADYERAIADTRARLDEPELAAAWSEGQGMSADQAVEYAFSQSPNVSMPW